jgi:hypothetical protein
LRVTFSIQSSQRLKGSVTRRIGEPVQSWHTLPFRLRDLIWEDGTKGGTHLDHVTGLGLTFESEEAGGVFFSADLDNLRILK